MEQKISFRTEIQFEGTIAEFGELAAKLVEMPLRLRVEWPPDHTAGCWPIGPVDLVNPRVLEAIAKGQPRLKIMEDFPGGIRDPHLHLKDEIVFLERARFKDLVGQVAMEVAGQGALQGEYTDVVGAIRGLSEVMPMG
jgi:hypothetical protein